MSLEREISRKKKLTANCALALFLFSGSPPPFFDTFQQSFPDSISTFLPFFFHPLALLVVGYLSALYGVPFFEIKLR
jgi:hypothetical protein